MPRPEPEPGSIIIMRLNDEREAQRRQEEVASWQTSVLGHVVRTCAQCGDEWTDETQCQNCGSNIFSERVVNPTPIMATAEPNAPTGHFWLPWRRTKPPELAPPDPADLAAVRAYLAALAEVEERLGGADAALRRLVNAGHTSFAQAQARVAEEVGRLHHGDRQPSIREIIEPKLTEAEAAGETNVRN